MTRPAENPLYKISIQKCLFYCHIVVHTDASDVSLLTTEVVTEEESSNLGDGHRRPSHTGTDEEERLHEATDDVMEESVDHAIEQVNLKHIMELNLRYILAPLMVLVHYAVENAVMTEMIVASVLNTSRNKNITKILSS